MTKKKAGRRTKFTAKTRAAILKAIAGGAMWSEAAAAGKISYETLREWLRAGEEEDAKPDKAAFSVQCQAAYEEGNRKLLQVVQDGADGQLEAIETIETEMTDPKGGVTTTSTVKRKKIPASTDAKWLLTRRDPELFGDQQKHKHEGQVDVAKTVIHNVGGGPPLSFENSVDPDDPLGEGEN